MIDVSLTNLLIVVIVSGILFVGFAVIALISSKKK